MRVRILKVCGPACVKYAELSHGRVRPVSEISPFRIEVDDAQLADLTDRLTRTRWPDPAPVDDWSQGVPLAYLRDLCDHWASAYDWRTRAARLNAFPQFRTEIDGLGIHFVHVRS